MKNSTYWKNRQARKMNTIQKLSAGQLKRVDKAYKESMDLLNQKIDKIFEKFQADGVLTKEEALKLLTTRETRSTLNALKRRYALITDPVQKRKILNIINAPAYRFRISKLQALKDAITTEYSVMTGQQVSLISRILRTAYTESFKIKDYDLSVRFGFKTAAAPSEEAIKRFLQHKLHGVDFVKRINVNNQRLAQKVTELIDTGLQSGMTKKQMIKVLNDSTDVGLYNARRIVVTETTFAVNQAETDLRRQVGIEEYVYVSVLDGKTSDICQNKNGKVYKTSEARAGFNLPPMHPNCRSFTIDKVSGGEGLRRARDKNGRNILVPKDISYKDYKIQYL